MEPATGESLAKVAMATTDDIDRAVDAARAALEGDWGRTAPTDARDSCTRSRTRSRRTGRSRGARGPERRQGDLVREVELNQAVENFRFYASAIASIAGRSNPMGGSLLLLAEGARWGGGADRPVELPADDDDLVACACAGGGLHDRAEARLADAADRSAHGRAGDGGRFSTGALNVVPGEGKTVGAHLVQHPGVDKIAFTGSTATGAEIMRLGSTRSSG